VKDAIKNKKDRSILQLLPIPYIPTRLTKRN